MSNNKASITEQKQRDPDLINAEVAIKRAAIKGRKLAEMSGTAVVTMKNGVINEEYPSHTN
ncbi:hypothetical protein AU255_15135 [Methyloprofundus sedimenti]|uniref:Uncharacterized protein n=1 Tax=Methyloprofundus sedimenti TaxID=1420851 RepID=A0A1V8M1X4_9GAMM|nr:hypothetical protein [Methyloprofundus sedimenti]OQK15559.1 hypothetical protein AU255_15135 [Methyloprofundus sedimenti]